MVSFFQSSHFDDGCSSIVTSIIFFLCFFCTMVEVFGDEQTVLLRDAAAVKVSFCSFAKTKRGKATNLKTTFGMLKCVETIVNYEGCHVPAGSFMRMLNERHWCG